MNATRIFISLLIVFASFSCGSSPSDDPTPDPPAPDPQAAFAEHVIATNYASPWSVVVIDFDRDGDKDIVGSARLGNRIDWWQNDGQQNFTMKSVSPYAPYAMGLLATDVDYDGDIDVVCGLNGGVAINLYRNNGAMGFSEETIAHWVAARVYPYDVDKDGFVDFVASACEGNDYRFGWFRNDGKGNFTPHVVKDNWAHTNSVYALDFDGDGDTDLFGTASFRDAATGGEASWFENDGKNNFTEHNLLKDFGRPNSIVSADVDRDGDKDIVVSSCIQSKILWLENMGAANFTTHIIAENVHRPHDLKAVDFDGDGDIDIISAAIADSCISLWENNGSQVFAQKKIAERFGGATETFISDLDGDGDLDVAGAGQTANKISWWENLRIK